MKLRKETDQYNGFEPYRWLVVCGVPMEVPTHNLIRQAKFEQLIQLTEALGITKEMFDKAQKSEKQKVNGYVS